jgi:histidyl-tRNA synthetase
MPRKKKIEAVKPIKKLVKKIEPISKLRGMKDVLQDENKYWQAVIKKSCELAKTYSYKKIDTPILESSRLYEKSNGKNSDLVSKEMYSFVDKDGERVSLRPEGTAGIVRSFIEHGMFSMPNPIKTFWLGPVFRREKPQAGRLRQHTQFNLDCFGDDSALIDAQLILIGYNFFKELQIDIETQINSIGCPDCRENYIKKLVAYYKEKQNRGKMCLDCKKRLLKNPLRILDCKEIECVKVNEGAPPMVDSLCSNCKKHFVKVLEYLDVLNVPYNLNNRLVRGLDYYNRTVFEFTLISDEEKRQSSLGGGGRYDYLVEEMGGRPTSACGFGIGLERTISVIRNKNLIIEDNGKADIFFAQLGESSKQKALVLFEDLRRSGFSVRESFSKESLKPQLEEADRVGAKFTLILGQKELMDKTIIIKDMESGVQEIVDVKKLVQELDRRVKRY